jgi:predicted pyridoxine 5'-phosphate oxidase superfamily flavin-nucleotide-binding protein
MPATLTTEMKDMVAYLRLCYVATASPGGAPNVSPKGSLKVLDDHRLVFADIDSPNTVANLRVNPRLEINIVDPILRRGYRFKGTAELSIDPELMRFAGAGLGADFPVGLAVVVNVDQALPVHSPVYFHTELREEEIRDAWHEKYDLWPAAKATDQPTKPNARPAEA